jgi:hypothetical protein
MGGVAVEGSAAWRSRVSAVSVGSRYPARNDAIASLVTSR